MTNSKGIELMEEVWQPVVGYEGLYEVSDLGRIRSLERWGPSRHGEATRLYSGKVLQQSLNGRGYLHVSLCRGGARSNGTIHRLVTRAFLGPVPEGMIVLHGPGGKTDNRLVNLSYGTSLQNLRDDKIRDGTMQRGERHGRSKLTTEAVRMIRSSCKSGAELARELGVTDTTIYNVMHGRTWRCV